MTEAHPNLAAEARAKAERHHAVLVDGALRVVSYTDPHLAYLIHAHATEEGRPVYFDCQPVDRKTGVEVEATHRHRWSKPGIVSCRHMARAALRLRREGIIRRDPDLLWVATAKCCPVPDSDPFRGLLGEAA